MQYHNEVDLAHALKDLSLFLDEGAYQSLIEVDEKIYRAAGILPNRSERRHKSEKWRDSRYQRKRNNDRRYF